MVSSFRFIQPAGEAIEQVASWTVEIDNYIMGSLGVFSTVNLQTTLIWANHHHSNGNRGKAWMLLGMAARLAYCLQVNVESQAGSLSERECRRRMMWNIRIMDRLLAGTVDEFSLSSKGLDTLMLPCDEYNYLSGLQGNTGRLEAFCDHPGVSHVGGFAALIRLFDTWRDILL